MILNLSAPPGQSISRRNNHLSGTHQSMPPTLSALGKGALMAKVYLKSAFRMIPVRNYLT